MFGIRPFYLGNFGRVPVYLSADALFLAFFVFNRPGDLIEKLVSLVCLLFTIIMHELGHATVATMLGMNGVTIMVTALGGYCSYTGDRRPARQLPISLAGPAVNLAIAGICWWIARTVDVQDPLAAAFLNSLYLFNLVLGIFNSLPIYPLDGGQVVLALTELVSKSETKARRFTLSLSVISAIGALIYFQNSIGLISMLILAYLLLAAFRDLR